MQTKDFEIPNIEGKQGLRGTLENNYVLWDVFTILKWTPHPNFEIIRKVF